MIVKRSNEPLFWSLFGAGGVVVAFIVPVVIFVTGVAVPTGIWPAEVMAYDRIVSFVSSWSGGLFMLVVISLTLWHAMHRIYLSLHDLGINRGRMFFRSLCYGIALAGTVSSVMLVAML